MTKGLARNLVVAGAFGIGMLLSSTAANAVTFAGTNGSLAASADFTIDGGFLKVVLTNTSTADTLVPIDVLTAVMWSGGGSLGTAGASALLTAGSTVLYDSQPAGGNVGGEWGYGAVSGGPSGATQGISSSGLGGLFGQPNLNGTDLQDPIALNGLQYGIVSAGDNAATGNGGITGSGGLIKNSVTFLLAITGSFDLSSITNVWFQYGTAMNEPHIDTGEGPNPVPLPGALPLLLTGLFGVGALGRMRKRNS